MFLTIAAILLVLWLLGLLVFHITAGFVHILVILAIVAVVVHFMRGRRSV